MSSNAMAYRMILLRVSDQLTNQQLDHLKFLSRTVIPNARMDRIRQSLDLFTALEERGKISSENVFYLRVLLESAGCHDALRELQGLSSSSTQVEQDLLFRQCLLSIAVELSSIEFDSLKFTLREKLRQNTDRIYTATDLFQLLIQRQIITTFDLKALYDLLYNMGRRDLSEAVNKYMSVAGRQQYQMLNQGGPVPTTLHTGGPQLLTPVEETPTNPHLPRFGTISSGVRTNHQSLASSLTSYSPGGTGQPSFPGTTMSERGSTSSLSSPPPRVDSGHSMRSVSGNSLDSSHPAPSTISSLDSQRSAIVQGRHVRDFHQGMPQDSSQGQRSPGIEYTRHQQQHYYEHSAPGVQSPNPQAQYSQSNTDPQRFQYGQVQSPNASAQYSQLNSDPQQFQYRQAQSPHTQAQYTSEHVQNQYQQEQLTSGQGRDEKFVPSSSEDHFQSPVGEQFLTFKLDEGAQHQASQNQQLQKELAQRDNDLRIKERDIENYEKMLAEMHSRINSVQDQQKGKELEYQQKITDLESVLRQMTTEAEKQRRDMQQLHHQLQLANPRSTQDDGDFYKMNKTPHGICLIINNHKFHHQDPEKRHPDRGGAEVDVHNLTQTFKYLCYKLEVVENLTSAEMKALMLNVANRDHAQYDSFVCCILTHGEREVVHGSDCEPVNLHDLAGVMKMCPTLHAKPKLFFIQACRGELESKGFEVPEKDTGGAPYSNTIPQESDFYFGFATPIGSSAYRSRRYGSWFISEVCQVFIKHAYTHDLGGMMTKVNKNVSDAYTKDGYKQSPESVDRLRFRVHFFRFLQSRGAIGGQ